MKGRIEMDWMASQVHGPHLQLVNVPIEHHPSIGDIISNRYLKVMFKIPEKGHLPTPVICMSLYPNWIEVR